MRVDGEGVSCVCEAWQRGRRGQGRAGRAAVEAIENIVTQDNGFFDESMHLGLMRFGHDPDPNNDGLDGVRASVDPPFAVLGVDVTQQQMPVVADAGSLRAAVAEATVALRRVELERQGVDRDLAFIDSIGVRAASDATEAGGTAALDLEAV